MINTLQKLQNHAKYILRYKEKGKHNCLAITEEILNGKLHFLCSDQNCFKGFNDIFVYKSK